MRKDKVKVGMEIAHHKTGRHLGTVLETRDNHIKFKPKENLENMPYGIAGYTEIRPYMGEQFDV